MDGTTATQPPELVLPRRATRQQLIDALAAHHWTGLVDPEQLTIAAAWMDQHAHLLGIAVTPAGAGVEVEAEFLIRAERPAAATRAQRAPDRVVATALRVTEADGATRIERTCNCPRNPCPHLALVVVQLRRLAEQAQALGEHALWFTRLATSVVKRPKPPEAEMRFWLRIEDRDRAARLVVLPRLRDPRTGEFRGIAGGAGPQAEQDHALVAALSPANRRFLAEVRLGLPVRSQGEQGFVLASADAAEELRAMLLAGVCSMDEDGHGVPLALGVEETCALRWQIAPNGDQTTAPAIEGARLFRVGALWYYRPDGRCIGPCRGTPAGTEVLLDTPPIPWQRSAPVNAAWMAHRILSRRPAPNVIEHGGDWTEPMQPAIRIDLVPRTEVRGGVERQRGEYAVLHYTAEYAAYPDPFGAREREVDRYVAPSMRRLLRDEAAEAAAAAQLEALGLVEIDVPESLGLSDVPGRAMARLLPNGDLEPPGRAMEACRELADRGFAIRFGQGFGGREPLLSESGARLVIEDDPQQPGVETIGLQLEVEGQVIDLMEALTEAIRQHGSLAFLDDATVWLAPRHDGVRVAIRVEALREALQPLLEFLGPRALVQSGGKPRLGRAAGLGLRSALAATNGGVENGFTLGLANLERRIEAVERVPPRPPGLAEGRVLDPHQQDIAHHLLCIIRCELGLLFADDRGTGKTLSLLTAVHEANRRGYLDGPVLAVMPPNAVASWMDEIAQSYPELDVGYFLAEPGKPRELDVLRRHTLVITTYHVLIRELVPIQQQHWAGVICDEADILRQHRSITAKAVRAVPAKWRIPTTGTPVNNRALDLWSLIDAALPGYAGTQRAFLSSCVDAEPALAEDALRRFVRRIAPFKLQRSKADLGIDLPPLTEEIIYVDLTERQREVYDQVRAIESAKLAAQLKRAGLAGSQLQTRNAMLLLREIAVMPEISSNRKVAKIRDAAKIDAAIALIEREVAAGRPVVLFSEWTRVLDRLAQRLVARGLSLFLLTGDNNATERLTMVGRFQAGEADTFLISRSAGGAAITLTRAWTVIQLDVWWAPAKMLQSRDRVFRRGLDHPVTVYTLISRNTVEETIFRICQDKAYIGEVLGEIEAGGAGVKRSVAFDAAVLREAFDAALLEASGALDEPEEDEEAEACALG
jgi:superfamily II DNA or RNA helicase